MIEFLRNNASWLFGSGGAVAAILAVMKAFGVGAGGKSSGDSADATAAAAAHSKGRSRPASLDALSLGIIAAALVAVIGLVLMFSGDRVVATDCGAAVQGSGNTTSTNCGDQ